MFKVLDIHRLHISPAHIVRVSFLVNHCLRAHYFERKDEKSCSKKHSLPSRSVEPVVCLVVKVMQFLCSLSQVSRLSLILKSPGSQVLLMREQLVCQTERHLLLAAQVGVHILWLLEILPQIEVGPELLIRSQKMGAPLLAHNNYNLFMPSLRATSFRM